MPYVKELYGRALGEGGAIRATSRSSLLSPYDESMTMAEATRDMARWPATDRIPASLNGPSVGEADGGFIPCGVCSVRRTDGTCASDIRLGEYRHRRLLSFESGAFSDSQRKLEPSVSCKSPDIQRGDEIRVWSEIRLLDRELGVDYRMDYVLRKDDSPPVIVEVTTASTSGGNRARRTDIRSEIADAVLDEHGVIPELGQSPDVNASAGLGAYAVAKTTAHIRSSEEKVRAYYLGCATIHYATTSSVAQSLNRESRFLRTDREILRSLNLISAMHKPPCQTSELYSGPIYPGDGTVVPGWLELPDFSGHPSARKTYESESLIQVGHSQA